ncbi:undecaprenyl-phosphate glucose phosphotransferase [Marinivivus vitaminiproducens]|uniref:undecaprenyl-phosphate glucose phosphotransferase n=1 Tax=Marinivivus vitaminiproducens TaxID=3035935 RepID=UPI00279A4A58|nr:undecaprenyl-phosphate glucose phosphotransferase [Geminicoccaceae bacterium SCSIO 64248]
MLARRVHRALDWLSPAIVVGILRVADILVVVSSGFLAYISRFGFDEIAPYALYSLVLAGILAANVFQSAGLYSFGTLVSMFRQSRRLLIAWTLVALALVTVGFLTKTLLDASRLWVSLWFVYGFVGLLVVRMTVKYQILRWQARGRLTRNVVVVGAGEHGQRFVEHLRRAGDESGIRLIGLFDDRKGRVPDYVAGFPVLGTVDDLLGFARRNPIDQVIIALPWDAEARLLSWIKKIKSLPVDVRLCPDMIGFHLSHRNVTHLGGVPLLNVFEKPLAGWAYVVKVLEDRFLAGLILLLIAPLMLILAAAIKLDSRGAVLYRQKRYGFNNEVIEVFKFRSMFTDLSDSGVGPNVKQATSNDPRITRVGRFIRRTSLDELPQFLNVLNGTMSIVGPRPHAVAHNEQYAMLIDEYLARHRVKPGITGWAQINGLRGETDTLDKMERRVQYDLYYIENWSLLFDLRIIMRTLLVGFVHPNAR